MADIEQSPPVLIVAQPDSVHAIPYFAGDLGEHCPDCSPKVVERIRTLAAYVDREFEFVAEIDGWHIYQNRNF